MKRKTLKKLHNKEHGAIYICKPKGYFKYDSRIYQSRVIYSIIYVNISLLSQQILPPTEEITENDISDEDDIHQDPTGQLLGISNVHVYR